MKQGAVTAICGPPDNDCVFSVVLTYLWLQRSKVLGDVSFYPYLLFHALIFHFLYLGFKNVDFLKCIEVS